jgi:hypothetical protein
MKPSQLQKMANLTQNKMIILPLLLVMLHFSVMTTKWGNAVLTLEKVAEELSCTDEGKT